MSSAARAFDLLKNNPAIAAAVVGVVVAAAWLTLRGFKQTGKDIGGGAVNLVVGVAAGAKDAVVENALDPAVNPFYPVGTTLGGWLFDLTHRPHSNVTPYPVKGTK